MDSKYSPYHQSLRTVVTEGRDPGDEHERDPDRRAAFLPDANEQDIRDIDRAFFELSNRFSDLECELAVTKQALNTLWNKYLNITL